jgi:hypothetical protein
MVFEIWQEIILDSEYHDTPLLPQITSAPNLSVCVPPLLYPLMVGSSTAM